RGRKILSRPPSPSMVSLHNRFGDNHFPSAADHTIFIQTRMILTFSATCTHCLLIFHQLSFSARQHSHHSSPNL
ncbi:unnamed protein product, partial [Bubo scandiacus]